MSAEPQSFGKYSVVCSLGRGGMAAVYEGRDALLERRVAIKVILPHLAEDPTFADRFKLEARLVASLRHPHIVRLYDFDISEGRPYMVMEFLEGGSLKERLGKFTTRGQTLPVEEALEIIHDLADALQYAHARAAVHRDIKPANILFASQSEAVITDFGIAKLLHESQQISNTGGIIGTPQYMSPEQASGKIVDGRSDQYSLAITAYEMLAGRVPFTAETATAILMAHLTEKPPSPRRFNPKLSLAIEEVLLQGLAKDPAQRFESAPAFAAALEAAARSGSAVKPPEKISAETPTQIDDAAAVGAAGMAAAGVVVTAPSEPETLPEEPAPRRVSLVSTEISPESAVETPIKAQPEIVARRQPARRTTWQRWAILGICLALILAAGSLLVPRLGGYLGAPAATALPGEFVVAVADFDGSQASQKIDVSRRIFEELESELATTDSAVRVVRTDALYPDRQAAITAGNEAGADLIIWGWYDDAGVSPSIQVIQPQLAPAKAQGSIFYNSAQAAGLDENAGIPEIDLNDFMGYLRVPRLVSDMDFFISNGPEQIASIAEAVLGMAFQAQGKPDSALELYDKALANPDLMGGESSAPGLERVYFLRGMARADLQRLPEAIQDLERAAELNPQMPEVFYNLAVLYPEVCNPQRRLGAAVEAGLQAAALAPEDSSTQRLLASLYSQLGQYPEALAAAQAALDSDPDEAASHLLLGDIYNASGDNRAAQAAWERGAALIEGQLPEPGQETFSQLIRTGDAYAQAGRLEEAAQAYLKAAALDAYNPDAQRGLGNVAFHSGDLTKAEQAYTAWVEAAPTDPAALTALGLVLLKQNKKMAGMEVLAKAANQSACSSNASVLAGGQYWVEGNYPQAEIEFNRAVEIEPDNPSTLYLLGVAQLFQEKLEPAVATLERARQANPELVIVQRALASALGSLGKYEQALPLWQELVQVIPDDPSGWVSLANAYEKLGDLDQAIDGYSQALTLGEDANIHIYLGLVYLQKNQPEQGMREFAEALKLNPQSSLAHGARGDALLMQGDIPGAIEAYRQSLALEDNPQLRASVANLLIQTGEIEAAAQELAQALEGDPQNAAARGQLGGYYSRLGKLDEAEAQYKTLLEVDPNHPEAFLGLGQIAYKRCDPDGMAQAFERAAALGEGNALYQALPGIAYGARGDLEQQTQVYFTLEQDFPANPLMLLLTGEYTGQQGDLSLAEGKLTQAAQASQLPPVLQSQARYDLGLIALFQNSLAAAEEQFRLALEASPANAASQAVLGDIFLIRGSPVQALEAYDLALGSLAAYGYQFSGEGADLLEPGLLARRGLALDRLKETEAAALAWQQAETTATRLVDLLPNWPQAHNTRGGVYLLMGDEARANAEFAEMGQCDAWLEISNAPGTAHLKRLR